jgi:hypothetical protein
LFFIAYPFQAPQIQVCCYFHPCKGPWFWGWITTTGSVDSIAGHASLGVTLFNLKKFFNSRTFLRAQQIKTDRQGNVKVIDHIKFDQKLAHAKTQSR